MRLFEVRWADNWASPSTSEETPSANPRKLLLIPRDKWQRLRFLKSAHICTNTKLMRAGRAEEAAKTCLKFLKRPVKTFNTAFIL